VLIRLPRRRLIVKNTLAYFGDKEKPFYNIDTRLHLPRLLRRQPDGLDGRNDAPVPGEPDPDHPRQEDDVYRTQEAETAGGTFGFLEERHKLTKKLHPDRRGDHLKTESALAL